MATKRKRGGLKGFTQKSGDMRPTKSGAGMTAKGVAKYNRRTGGNLKNAATEVDGYTRIIRLSPMASAFESGSSGFGEQNEDGIMFIPSDNLMYRDPSPSSGGFNIQDANLLKIKVQYCYELIVPMVNKIIGSLSQLNNTKTSGFHPMIDDTDPRFSDMQKYFEEYFSKLDLKFYHLFYSNFFS